MPNKRRYGGMAMLVFADRVDAGRQLAARLEYLHGQDMVVLGLPRGGVPVAFEVAEALDAPLDVIVVRKLGVPFQPELAMGAIGEEGVEVLDAEVLMAVQVTEEQLNTVRRRERAALEARVALLRRGRARVDLNGRIAVIVDDGIATGSTARVACEVARHLGAARVVLAVPVAAGETVGKLAEADEVVCVSAPRWFMAVGNHYRDFSPTNDDGVIILLDAAARRIRDGQPAGDRPDCDIDVEIPVDTVALQGHLYLPEPAAAAAATARATGSSPGCSTAQAWARCCSTCSLRKRNSTAPTSSTWNCSRAGLPQLPGGSLVGPTPHRAASDTSVRAREPELHYGRRRRRGSRSRRSSRVAAVRTWPGHASPGCGPQRC